MKQKIVMKVQMNSEKCRAKALKIVAQVDGVTSVAIEGPDKDKLAVVGDDIDTASLSSALKKKLGHSFILTVEEVKPKPPEKKAEEIMKEAQKKKPNPHSDPYAEGPLMEPKRCRFRDSEMTSFQ